MNTAIELKALETIITEQESKVSELVSIAEKILNGKAKDVAVNVKASIDGALKDVAGAVNALNKSFAKKYYMTSPLFDIVKAGKAVPCKVFEVVTDEETERVSVSVSDDVAYPTLSGLNGAKVLPDGVPEKVDLLRREVAYLDSGKKAKVYLTGDVENKKDVPSKKVAELIEKEGDISVNKAKSTMAVVLKELTGDAYKQEVFSALFKDFTRFIVKRGAEWTERNMVSKGVAGDMVLEYAYMYFNNLRDVKYILG